MTVPLEDPDVTTEFRKVAARETVDDGRTGMLVENDAGAWIGALETLVILVEA